MTLTLTGVLIVLQPPFLFGDFFEHENEGNVANITVSVFNHTEVN